jgi:hypothetical protein
MFHSASDPDVSFDGQRFLFSGKEKASDPWNIFEMAIDGTQIRQITRDAGNCRSPKYQSTLYTIVSTEPWYQITFISDKAGQLNEASSETATHLYSCKLDGSEIRRLTFNVSSDVDPFLMDDGRILFSSWQRSTLVRGSRGRVSLFALNIDGTDLAIFSGDEGLPIKLMPCTTPEGLAVFVESNHLPWDGAGRLASVKLRRNLHSYRSLTENGEGLFHSPSPFEDGRVLVSRRSSDGSDTHGIFDFDPNSGVATPIYDDPKYHDIQPKLVSPRKEPDGRSSVVNTDDPNGQLYGLNVYHTDLERQDWMPSGTVRRIRLLEGVPFRKGPHGTRGSVASKRLLGEIPVQQDGSFFAEIPANIPVQIQTLDENGMALRTCSWIWVKNREKRGCIGCHEDGELTPENRLVQAAEKPPYKLDLPPNRRRAVDFERDVVPIIERRCLSCHQDPSGSLQMDTGGGPDDFFEALTVHRSSPDAFPEAEYVDPGRARTSPLTWELFGKNTSRPWDSCTRREFRPSAPHEDVLTLDEKRVFVEWIDFGALRYGRVADAVPQRNEEGSGGPNEN